MRRRVDSAEAPPRGGAEPRGCVTPRESEVLHRVVVGRSNREVAEELPLSPRTVEAHRSRVTGKMRARLRGGAGADGDDGRAVRRPGPGRSGRGLEVLFHLLVAEPGGETSASAASVQSLTPLRVSVLGSVFRTPLAEHPQHLAPAGQGPVVHALEGVDGLHEQHCSGLISPSSADFAKSVRRRPGPRRRSDPGGPRVTPRWCVGRPRGVVVAWAWGRGRSRWTWAHRGLERRPGRDGPPHRRFGWGAEGPRMGGGFAWMGGGPRGIVEFLPDVAGGRRTRELGVWEEGVEKQESALRASLSECRVLRPQQLCSRAMTEAPRWGVTAIKNAKRTPDVSRGRASASRP